MVTNVTNYQGLQVIGLDNKPLSIKQAQGLLKSGNYQLTNKNMTMLLRYTKGNFIISKEHKGVFKDSIISTHSIISILGKDKFKLDKIVYYNRPYAIAMNTAGRVCSDWKKESLRLNDRYLKSRTNVNF